MNIGCIVCGSNEPLNKERRCGICAVVKDAIREGKSYGSIMASKKEKFVPYDGLIILEDEPKKSDFHEAIENDMPNIKYKQTNKRICIVCGGVIGKRNRIRTCSDACNGEWMQYMKTHEYWELQRRGYFKRWRDEETEI